MTKSIYSFASLMTLSIFLKTPAPALADWLISNKSPVPVSVAIGYFNSDGSQTSKGWWTLAACTGQVQLWHGNLPINGNSPTEGVAWYYAQQVNGYAEWTGEAGFCTDSQGFTLGKDAQNERGCTVVQGRVMKSFKRVIVPNGEVYTTILTGPVNGRSCF
jgi:uncharacterized membrane protein